jgi:hypothetical protein
MIEGMKKLLLLLFSLPVLAQAPVCHNCYETEWQTQTATVRCGEAGEVVEYLNSLGFQTLVKTRMEGKEMVCDILGVK